MDGIVDDPHGSGDSCILFADEVVDERPQRRSLTIHDSAHVGAFQLGQKCE